METSILHLSDSFPIQNGKPIGMKLNGTYQLLVYVVVNLLEGNIDNYKEKYFNFN
jgi:hypothetical protein